jgi:WD40 repeat protein
VTAVTYLPGGELVSAGLDCGFHLWNSADGELINTFENLIVDSVFQGERVAVRIWNLTVFQNKFLIGGLSGKFGIWEVDSGALLYLLEIPNYSETVAAFEDSVVVAGSPMKFGTLTEEGPFVMVWEGNNAIEAVAISPDGQIILSGTSGHFNNHYRNGSLHFWLADNGDMIGELMPVTDNVTGLAFAPNGRYFVSTTLDGVVRLWGVP